MLVAVLLLLLTHVVSFKQQTARLTVASRLRLTSEPVSQLEHSKNEMPIKFAKGLLVALTSTVLMKTTPAFGKEVTEDEFITAFAYILASKKVLDPVKLYLDNAAFDFGRTNINYVINQLSVAKYANVLLQGSMEFSENEDALEAAQEAGSEISNLMTQYDSSVYTLIFIPVDDTTGKVSKKEQTFVKMCDNYRVKVEQALKKLLALGSEKQLSAAKMKAEAIEKALPPFLFKTQFKSGGGGMA